MGHETYTLWQLGSIDQAIQNVRIQLELAKELPPANVAMARMSTCNLAMYLWDADELISAANDMLKLGEELQLLLCAGGQRHWSDPAKQQPGRH
jgi:hypothetical protein